MNPGTLGFFLVATAILAPLAGAGGVVCGDPCAIAASGAGYLPPADVIYSGTEVTWTSLDTSHPTADVASGPRCFVASPGASTSASPVRFDIAEGFLWATSDIGTVDEATAKCTGAKPLEGGFVMPYNCLLHPQMKAVLVVIPDA